MSSSHVPHMDGSLQSLTIAMAVLSTVAVILRFWSRALLPRQYSVTSQTGYRFGWDDWTVLGALVFSLGCQAMTLRMIKLGVGKHATDVSEANVSEILKLLWVNEFLFTPGLTLAKSSALFFYERVFHNANSRFKSALWIVQIATYLWMVGVLLAVATLCIPAEKNWKPSVPGHCVNVDTFWLANGITSIMIDVIILILPLPMLWQLQMKLSNKILLIGV
ncbi:MAG: hypothetical protein M1821_003732, partial [Bathelium mastoideum]